MRYYYFNPFSKKLYFPEGFKKYSLFATFYQPYKMSARLMWELWQSSALFRYLFSTDEHEEVLPLEQIGQFVTPDTILAFNLGTSGVEQKITVLGVDTSTNATFFMKYATSKVACKNVFNEGVVLQQLVHLPFVPKMQLNVNLEDEFSLIKTSVLKGDKMKHLSINRQILEMLYTLSQQNVKSNREYDVGLINCFAHGDFCPWNMLVFGCEIELFDWELAGEYPLGYDLFTYIFQYEFLVKERKRFELLLTENATVIKQYFNHFNIENWIPYLQEFATLKYKLEMEKNNSDLIEPYSQLKQYVSTYLPAPHKWDSN